MKRKHRAIILSDTALRILEARYLLRNRRGKIIETPAELFERVAKKIASVEPKKQNKIIFENEFYNLLSGLKFLPNSPTLMNAGLKNGQLSACFVLPVEDHLSSIFDTIKNTALIHKTGGGTGFDFSKLRSKGAEVSTAIGVAAGPVSFLKLFDATTEIIKQGGVRRGANMGVLRIDHPDILEFINEKNKGTLSNFNISVAVTNRFFKALKKNKKINLIDPFSKKIKQKISSKYLWNQIIESAWKTGDPGLLFIDEINKSNPTPNVGKIVATNPCGEQPLLPYESCNLGSIDVSKYVFSKKLNWNELEKDIHTCIRFLDNVIDANHYPLKEVDYITKQNRKIGLGIMGWADLLTKLELSYENPYTIRFAEKFMKRFQSACTLASERLAKEKGMFPNFKQSIWKKGIPRRNATVTTIAPTGTISLIADCSSGIEPLFALAYERTSLEGKKFIFINKEILRINNLKPILKNIKFINNGTLSGIKNIPQKYKNIFSTSYEISAESHLRMQAAFQKYCENAVSKTVNLANKATKDEISKIYHLAAKLKCKGITVYRDRSKSSQVLRAGVVR